MAGGFGRSASPSRCQPFGPQPAAPSSQSGIANAEPFRVLSLFAGIGGFDLGLERTGGFKTVAFCEIEPFAVRVLNKHWPEVPVYGDVRELTGERLRADGIAVDCIVGGFPCQDISFAGRGAGLAGERSGLFFEVARLIGELGPGLVILENVSALLSRGLADVLGTLASLGYDAEWDCIPAAYVGAPHRRDRIWIVAYRQGNALGSDANGAGPYRAALHVLGSPELRHEQVSLARSVGEDVADPASERRNGRRIRAKPSGGCQSPNGGQDVAHPVCERQPGPRQSLVPSDPEAGSQGQAVDALNGGLGSIWTVEPDVGRVAHGVPSRVDRLKGLGNAVVPQIPELIGRAILQAERGAA